MLVQERLLLDPPDPFKATEIAPTTSLFCSAVSFSIPVKHDNTGWVVVKLTGV
jgi:hypothetical protein